MKKFKIIQSKGARIVKENKRTDIIHHSKDEVGTYKGFSYFMTLAPKWISKYHTMLQNA